MTKKQKRHIIATVGTILFLLLVFLFLWYVTLTAVKPIEEEGVEIAFGEVEDAGGYMPEESEAVPLPTPETTAPEQPAAPSDNDLMTQEDENALALRKAQEEAEKARKQAEALEKQRQREEQARLEAERKAKEKAEAERKAKEEAERKKAEDLINGMGFGQGQGNSGTGNSGSGGGSNDNAAKGASGGGRDSRISGLVGRNTRDGKLPNINECKPSSPCKVVVLIRLDKEGNVIISSSSNTSGTNTGDAEFIKCVENALRKTKWTEGDGFAEGTITYIITQQMIENN